MDIVNPKLLSIAAFIRLTGLSGEHLNVFVANGQLTTKTINGIVFVELDSPIGGQIVTLWEANNMNDVAVENGLLNLGLRYVSFGLVSDLTGHSKFKLGRATQDGKFETITAEGKRLSGHGFFQRVA